MTESYEFRFSSYLSLRTAPSRHVPIGWAEAMRELQHLEAYADFGISCELREWEDRANREDCWRDWWKTGRDWIAPEEE